MQGESRSANAIPAQDLEFEGTDAISIASFVTSVASANNTLSNRKALHARKRTCSAYSPILKGTEKTVLSFLIALTESIPEP